MPQEISGANYISGCPVEISVKRRMSSFFIILAISRCLIKIITSLTLKVSLSESILKKTNSNS
jgi:hypothetical protein